MAAVNQHSGVTRLTPRTQEGSRDLSFALFNRCLQRHTPSG